MKIFSHKIIKILLELIFIGCVLFASFSLLVIIFTFLGLFWVDLFLVLFSSLSLQKLCNCLNSVFFFFIFHSNLSGILFFFICGGFCHTLRWNSHGFTCVPYPDPPSHLPLHPLPLGLPSAPGPSTCLMHPTWAGDLFHPR